MRSLCSAALLTLAALTPAPLPAFDGPKGPAQARSRLTAANFAKVKAGSGQLTEAEVVTLLGPASRVRLPADGVVEMAWEEVTAIRVEFAGGKASELTGRFSAHLPSRT